MKRINLSALDLNLLVALEALLEEASVGRAAAKVALSQPAMSHALKKLRHVTGDPLLVRVGTRMERTARGAALHHPVKDVMARMRDLLASEDFAPADSIRTFRLFVSDNASDLLLPPLLKHLRKTAPNISLRIQPWAGTALDPFELARRVDVAIACVPRSFKGFYQQRLFTDRDACAVRRGNPMARKISAAKGLLEAKHVAVVGREFAEDPVDTWLREEGLQRNVVLTVPQYLQALHAVAQSDLVAIVPERLIRANAAVLGLEALPVPLDVGTFDEFLLHPAPTHSDPGCTWLRGVLKGIAESLGPLPTQRVSKIPGHKAANSRAKQG